MSRQAHRNDARPDGYLDRVEKTVLAARVFALGSLGVLVLGFCLGEFSGIGDLQQRAEKYGDWDGIAAMLFLVMNEGSLASWSWSLVVFGLVGLGVIGALAAVATTLVTLVIQRVATE